MTVTESLEPFWRLLKRRRQLRRGVSFAGVFGMHQSARNAKFPIDWNGHQCRMNIFPNTERQQNAAVILRFETQDGLIVLPKSTHADRMEENLDFSLTQEEMAELRSLDTGKGVHDPETPGLGERLSAAYKVHD